MNDPKNILANLLEYATKQGADLHICPKSVPFARIGDNYGALQQVPGCDEGPMELATVKAFINVLLTPEQKSELQKNKHLDFTFTHGDLGRFRAYAYSQRGTYAITIQTLPFAVPNFYELGLPDELAEAIENTVMDKNGLVIIAGDYISKKSQTLAALVDLINQKRNCHISTIESPIEYLHRHKQAVVVQKEIGADIADIKTVLAKIRQENPDVLAISELRKENFLSVMELAEERLVLASMKINQLNKDRAIGVMRAVIDTAIASITMNEDERKNYLYPFIPQPRISVIFQKPHETTAIDGELLTWEMHVRINEYNHEVVMTTEQKFPSLDAEKIKDWKKIVRAEKNAEIRW